MFAVGRRALETFVSAARPALRAIGLAYTGLGGMIALVLVMGVAAIPVSPVLEQAAQPARQAVSDFVQPTGDALVQLFGGPPARPVVAGPRRLSAPLLVDVTIAPLVEPE